MKHKEVIFFLAVLLSINLIFALPLPKLETEAKSGGDVTNIYQNVTQNNTYYQNVSEVDPFWSSNYSAYNSTWSQDTTYSAGSNLTLAGTIFGINITALTDWFNTIYQTIGSYLTLSDLLSYNYFNSTNFPYTSLTNFTDNLGNRGYTNLLNFTNGANYYNLTTAPIYLNDTFRGSNYSAFLTHITWANAVNGTLFTTALYNSNYSINDLIYRSFTANYSTFLTHLTNSSMNKSVSCIDIFGSPDTDFCTDATGTGGGISGVGAFGYIPMWNGTSSLNNSNIFQLGNNIGIGTTSPTGKLHIPGASGAPSETPANSGILKIGNDATEEIQMGYVTGSRNWIQSYGSVPLVINELGNNVGIGTTSPSALLHVLGITGEIGRFRANGANAQTDVAIVNDVQTWGFRVDGADVDNFKVMNFQTSTPIMTFLTGGNVGIGTTNPLSKLSVGGNGYAGPAIFATSTSNYGAIRGEGSDTGIFGVGGTYGVRGYTAATGGKGVWGDGPSGGYDFYAYNSDGSTAYGTSSSIRWKDNITEISNALDKVLNLKGVYFNWKDGGTHDMGFIAEDVGKVIPEVVSYETNITNSSNYYMVNKSKVPYATGIDYGALTPMLVEAIKEQQIIIVSQNKTINQMSETIRNQQILLDKICLNNPDLCK